MEKLKKVTGKNQSTESADGGGFLKFYKPLDSKTTYHLYFHFVQYFLICN